MTPDSLQFFVGDQLAEVLDDEGPAFDALVQKEAPAAAVGEPNRQFRAGLSLEPRTVKTLMSKKYLELLS